MYSYGHGSWIFLVVLAGTFALRALSQRRRRGGPMGRGPGSSFTSGDRPGSEPGPVGGSGGVGDGSGTAPGWFKDPFVRHDQRYWSGTAWTEHVSDQGTPGTDPPPVDSGRRSD